MRRKGKENLDELTLDFELPPDSRWTPLKGPWYDCGSLKYWCRCSCGTERSVALQSLRNGTSKSCGCLRRDQMVEKSKRNVQKAFEDEQNSREDKSRYLWSGLSLGRYAVISIIPIKPQKNEAVIVQFDRQPSSRRWCIEYRGNGHYFETYDEMKQYFENRFKRSFEPLLDAGTTIEPNWFRPV